MIQKSTQGFNKIVLGISGKKSINMSQFQSMQLKVSQCILILEERGVKNIPDLSASLAAIIYHITSHLIQAGFKMATAFPLGKFHYCPRDRGEDVRIVLVPPSTAYKRQCPGLSLFAEIQ